MKEDKITDVRDRLIQKVKLRKELIVEFDKMKLEVNLHFDNFKKKLKQKPR